jgi:hypothetical protein
LPALVEQGYRQPKADDRFVMPQMIVYLTREALGDDPLSDIESLTSYRDQVAGDLNQGLRSQGVGALLTVGMATVFTDQNTGMLREFDAAAFAQAKAGEANLAKLGMNLGIVVTLGAAFEVHDFDEVAANTRRNLDTSGHNHKIGIARSATPSLAEGDVTPVATDTFEHGADVPPYKSIEIYYDIDSIPKTYGHPLDFRNTAMELIEAALEAEEAGEWSGAEIGMGEVNFGFEVEDFEIAEAIVRKAVKGTDFANIREITRYDSAADDA